MISVVQTVLGMKILWQVPKHFYALLKESVYNLLSVIKKSDLNVLCAMYLQYVGNNHNFLFFISMWIRVTH